MLNAFREHLVSEGKSHNTIDSYLTHLKGFYEWYYNTYGKKPNQLFRPNILEYRSYLDNIRELRGSTINAIFSALIKYNEFIVSQGVQKDIVVTSKDFFKIQQHYASPATVTKKEVEAFRQAILEGEKKRDYALVTLLAYGGLRISEALNLKMSDVNLPAGEIIVRNGKGNKQRIVFLNDKIVNSIKEYLKERKGRSNYLFISRGGAKMSRTRVNQIFSKYSNKITPHMLRHFYCSNALDAGYSVHEVANQAGHSNIHTTLLYTNPDRKKMKAKANLL